MAAEGSVPHAHASGGVGAPTALQRLAAFTQGVRQHMQQPGSSLPAHLRQDAPRPAPVELPEEAFMEGNPDLFRNLCLAAGVRDRARCSVDVYGATHAGADFEELRSRQDAQHLQKQCVHAAHRPPSPSSIQTPAACCSQPLSRPLQSSPSSCLASGRQSGLGASSDRGSLANCPRARGCLGHSRGCFGAAGRCRWGGP